MDIEKMMAEDMRDRMNRMTNDILFGEPTTTATQSQEPQTLTVEELKELIDSMPDPVADFMKKRGCDPKDGWKMILPISYREHIPTVSRHVEYCTVTDRPLFINPKMFPSYMNHGKLVDTDVL